MNTIGLYVNMCDTNYQYIYNNPYYLSLSSPMSEPIRKDMTAILYI